ncbi:DNA-processing protein DprA [Oceanibaculum pacificum]|uniref:DNA processing protein DprA n=1 Tax=Oceanibaculum pacificum TaxID=580166 RepID=A0A154W857_9PROT|nr:DNA-processing protein DprA [Oceanibaculum pacificum]KZD09676.1 DNA processing protein DprA [Oceanibaculum pacificum]
MIDTPGYRRIPSEQERVDWLRLIRTENVGPVTFRQLLGRYGSVGRALEALPELARQGGRAKPLSLYPKAVAERELAALARLGATLVTLVDPAYPPALAAVPDAPPVFSLRGHAYLLEKPTVAIVGARNASANGRTLAERIARGLGEAGFLVASGLARGIDAAAHAGSLAQGTAAVVAGGIDVIYPEENTGLYEDIWQQGVIIAESAPGTQPTARHFPRRNRIISGLALGTVVVEAAERSGSLITARFAGEQGREVMAVPGSPLDPRCRGTNRLIRTGATLVETAEDVIEAVSPMLRRPLSEGTPDLFDQPPVEPDAGTLTQARRQVIELLGPSPVSVDELIRQCQLSPSIVLTVLLEIDLAGRLERLPGNKVALRVVGD